MAAKDYIIAQARERERVRIETLAHERMQKFRAILVAFFTEPVYETLGLTYQDTAIGRMSACMTVRGAHFVLMSCYGTTHVEVRCLDLPVGFGENGFKCLHTGDEALAQIAAWAEQVEFRRAWPRRWLLWW